jgi:hypothetical protein
MALIYVAVLISGEVAGAQKSVWPELAVFLLMFGSCALIEWRARLKKKRELESKERRSPNTEADPPSRD